MTIYEQIGGKGAINTAVDIFYKKVLLDKSISHFFTSTDMNLQRNKQKAFLTMVLGGPAEYTGLDMRKAHQHLVKQGLNENHFNAVLNHLASTLEELNVDNSLIEQVAKIALSVKDDVLDR